MAQITRKYAQLFAAIVASAGTLYAQAPQGPMAPRPGQPVQEAPASAQANIKQRVVLVSTPVTVRDAKGELVDGLGPRDFRITDNGAEQKILHFDVGGQPVSLVILVETSSRIAPFLPQIQKAGILLTQNVMGPSGDAAVVGFDDGVNKLQDFTSGSDSVENTIAHLQTGTSGARLFDAMSVAVEMLSAWPPSTSADTSLPKPIDGAASPAPARRRVLLIVAEALDTGSETKLGAVLRQAQLANITIYSVGLSTTRAELQSKKQDEPLQMTPPGINRLPPQPGTIQTPTTEQNRYGTINLLNLAVWAVQHADSAIRDHPLEIAAAATGGAHFATFKDHSIENAIDEIGGELHSQYFIAYTPTDAATLGYHEIRVTLVHSSEKKLKIRARPGYYLPSP
ncbi:MAG TPA: VWA domain-containing protein [Candidatus Methylomirabilis sp.]|nr:VWA domain-containing protein [Candidatus Methylomirabilis sp.]